MVAGLPSGWGWKGLSWEELSPTDRPGRFTIEDARLLLERVESPALGSWGIVDQRLPL